MAGIAISSRVVARDSFGQFIAAIDAGITESVKEAIEEGANLSRAMAPAGHKPDPRTVPLKGSISSQMLSATSGQWMAVARHALAIEFGAGPHLISGDPLAFEWEQAPDGLFVGPRVNHPGNAAQPYLRPAYAVVMGNIMAILAANLPG